jgi:hypothetical protein
LVDKEDASACYLFLLRNVIYFNTYQEGENMKKMFLSMLLLISIFVLISCDNNKKEITCDDVIKVYEEAGYKVFHKETTNDLKYECYVQCTASDSEDYIIFHFFETYDEAESYTDERDWNVILFIFSCAMFEPTWLTTKTYNNIEIEYHENYLYKPFKSLI